tara:strand:+ start:282 stop:1136 length:855 start_codon:yes stop_codon:yes gene_type:complete
MKLNDLKSTYETKMARVNRWLEETYGFKVYDKVDVEKLYATKEQLDIQREELKKSLPFNSYHEHPEYAKNILLSEAIVLMIGQIADEDMPAKADDDNEDGEDSPLTTDNNSDEVTEELTAAQKKLPAGLQKAIAKKQGDKEEVKEGEDLEQAETVLASKNLVDTLQGMVEDLGKMQNEDLAAITDQMQNQFGVDKAGSFNANVNGIIDNLLNAAKEAKESVNNEVLMLQGEAPASTMADEPSMDMPADDEGDSLEIDEPVDAETDGDDSASGPLDEPLGRAKKA